MLRAGNGVPFVDMHRGNKHDAKPVRYLVNSRPGIIVNVNVFFTSLYHVGIYVCVVFWLQSCIMIVNRSSFPENSPTSSRLLSLCTFFLRIPEVVIFPFMELNGSN